MKHEYQESRITLDFDGPSDLYTIHQRVMVITDGNKHITYAPRGLNQEGRMVVILRTTEAHAAKLHQIANPNPIEETIKSVEDGMTFRIQAGVRLVKRSDSGERMPTEDKAMEKWKRLLAEGGFIAENTRMVESNIAFFHRRLKRNTRLPFWAVSSTLTVVDAEKAAATMVRGIGRSRGLGFGMLMQAAA